MFCYIHNIISHLFALATQVMEAENHLLDPRIRPFLRREILANTGAWACVQDLNGDVFAD